MFTRQRIAVFVDGCFWHACPVHGTSPASNAQFWATKLAANQHRDRDTDLRLEAAAWQVVRVWEHERADTAADIVEAALKGSSGP